MAANPKNKYLQDGVAVATNRRARFDYELTDKVEAGLVLKGTEVKSLRLGHVNLQDAYGEIRDGEAWLRNVLIEPYAMGNRFNPTNSRGDRKLLLHKREIEKLIVRLGNNGLTLIPTRLFFTKGKAKVELAVARGKKQYDKRHAIKEREENRDAHRLKKEFNYM